MKLKLHTLMVFLLLPALSSCRVISTTGPGSTSPYIYHIGETDTPGFAYAVDAGNNRVYLADGLGGLRIIDVTIPHFPNQLAYFEDDGVYYDVKYAGGDYAYVAAGSAGFKIIDVNSPFGPELVGQYQTHNAYGLDFAGNYVYLADDTGGIRILDVTNHFNIIQISNIIVSDRKSVV